MMNIRYKLLTFVMVMTLLPVTVTIIFSYFLVSNELTKRQVHTITTDFQIGLIIIFVVSLILTLLGAFYFSHLFVRPIIALTEKTNSIIQGDLSQKIEVTSSDEIGRLAESFNKMTTQLAGSYGKLEQKVQDKTVELNQKMIEMERINKFMIGRELKMIDLKKEVETLKATLDKQQQIKNNYVAKNELNENA